MRLAVAAMVLGWGAASAAAAQDVSPRDHAALMQAAFAPLPAAAPMDPTHLSPVAFRASEIASHAGPLRWSSGEFQLSSSLENGPVDTMRLTISGAVATPSITALNLRMGAIQPTAYEVALIRNWPAAVRYAGTRFDVDLTPHAGLGLGNLGGSAEAGATLRLSHKSRDQIAAERLRALGVGDGARFGDAGRWYLFIAASGRAVGLNMLHNNDGWNRAGWTTDATSGLVGDAQLGVGWRKGMMQTSLGYIRREVRGQHMIWGQETRADSMLAFSLSLKPHY